MKMLKCMRWIMLVTGMSLLTGEPVRANEELPEYYRPVIEDYEKNLDRILDVDFMGPYDSPYISQLGLTNARPSDKIIYSIQDLDHNGIPELLLTGVNEYRSLFHIFTFNGEEVVTVAGYDYPERPDTGEIEAPYVHLSPKSGLDFYQDGRLGYRLTFSASGSFYAFVTFNEGGDDIVPIAEYSSYSQNDTMVYEDKTHQKFLTEDEYRSIMPGDDELIDIYEDWQWYEIGGGESVQESSQVDVAFSEEMQDYLNRLRDLNHRWYELLDTSWDTERITVHDLMALDIQVFDDANVYHPIIPAMYRKAQDVAAEYDESEDAHYRIRNISDLKTIAQNTFAIEKMLLPELTDESLEALNHLRFYCLAAYYEAINQAEKETGFLSYGFILESLDGMKYDVAELFTVDDARYDLLNRISIVAGESAEINGFGFKYWQMEYFQNPYPEGTHHIVSMRTSAGAQDISGVGIFFIDKYTGEMQFATLGNTNNPQEIDPFDYQAYYQVDVTNHYPAFEPVEFPELPAPSFDAKAHERLGNIMQSWGSTMNQVYQQYTLEHPVDFYGGTFPRKTFEINLDGEITTIHYQHDGDGILGIRIDAVYSDIEDTANSSDERHLYLFVADPTHPRVLVALQGPDADGHTLFWDTQNSDLIGRFNFLVKELYQE